jgi:FAD:protein FMN transferase
MINNKRQAVRETRLVIRASFLFVLIVFTLINLAACSDSLESHTLSGATMGTTYHITIVATKQEKIDLNHLQSSIDSELHKINRLMSTYIADSELSQFNQAPIDTWFSLSPETFKVIEYSLSVSKLSGGKFDVTVSPLINLWGFGVKETTDFPTAEAIDAARLEVGWQSIVLDKVQQRIKKNKSLSINLSAVAKGYGVDYIAQLLESYNVQHYLVEIGGEIRVKGKNKDNVFWKIGIEVPSFLQKNAQQIISINNKAIATSGDYRNFFEKDGVRYSHTIDPETGKPVVHNIASITVIAETAMEADALATAFMAMGEEKALATAKVYNIPLYMLLYDNDRYISVYSSSFESYFQ